MIHAQDAKVVELFAPQSVATNGTASGTVSCLGFAYATVYLHLGTAAASNVDGTVQVSESDGTTYATHADLALTTAAPNTSAGQIYAWFIDLRKRKKNLKIQYNPNTNVARLAEAHVVLSRAQNVPDTATLRGLAAQVIA